MGIPTAEEFIKTQFNLECPSCRAVLTIKALVYKKDANGIPLVQKLPETVYCVPCQDQEIEDTWIHLNN